MQKFGCPTRTPSLNDSQLSCLRLGHSVNTDAGVVETAKEKDKDVVWKVFRLFSSDLARVMHVPMW